ncbi:hypothetical protein WDZ92_25900, partial [Nostoc sp. NIES-2111]
CAQIYVVWEGESGLEAAHCRIHLPLPDSLGSGIWRLWEQRLGGAQPRPLQCFTSSDLGTVGLTEATKAALAGVSDDLLEALGTPRGKLFAQLARPFLDGPGQRVPVMPWFAVATLFALALTRDEDQVVTVQARGVVAPVDCANRPLSRRRPKT